MNLRERCAYAVGYS